MVVSRRTLRDSVEISGLGLHAGAPVRVRIHPGDNGIAFRLGQDRIPARPDQVTDTRRCTTLGPISTIEHLMSALAGLEVTDAEIELDAPELPALDGSGREWVRLFEGAGISGLPEQTLPDLFGRVFEKSDGVTIAIARGQGHWRYRFDTGHRWPGVQEIDLYLDPGVYVRELASARTLVFEEEIELARSAGLGKGLDETSVLGIGQSGYLNEARYPDEPARHKMLDLIGDLYLAGIPIRQLDVSAELSGHAANVRAARKLWDWVHRNDVGSSSVN